MEAVAKAAFKAVYRSFEGAKINTHQCKRFKDRVQDSEASVMRAAASTSLTEAQSAALRKRFPDIAEPGSEDICYATTNRQEAVKAIAQRGEAVIVIGAPNSSNSNRLVEVALRSGCEDAALVERVDGMDWARYHDKSKDVFSAF